MCGCARACVPPEASPATARTPIMTLRRKSLAIFASTLACSLLIVYSAAEWVLSRGFADIERRDAGQRLQRFHAALADRARQLDVIAADYAAWDDSWDFVETRSPTYIRATLLSTSLSTADIDLIAYLDTAGNLVFGGRPDPEQSQTAPPPAWFLDHIKAGSALLELPRESSSLRGLLVSPEGPVLIAARPIIKSDRTGPIRGTLIMGRFLGDEVLQNIRDVLIEQPVLREINAPGLTSSERIDLVRLLAGEAAVIEAPDEETTTARALIRDVYSRPALLVTLRLTREIHEQSHVTLRTMAACLLVTIAGCGLITMRLLNRQILARVTALDEAARRITSSRNAAERVPISGRDELSRLGHSVNEMLEALQATELNLRQAKETAEQANQTKSRFLANVSHELRTPLTAVMGFTEAILASSDKPAVTEQARTILSESESLLALINDLLDHAKIEAGRLELEQCPINLRGLLATVQQLALAQARGKAIQVKLDCAQVPEWVLADPLRLRQVLINLSSNAVKFTEQGSIRISAECLGAPAERARIRFAVQDTGVGIPKDRQSSIFERFTQVDSSTTRRYGGTGLGTTIARQLVMLMGGEIGLDSEVGRGSTFWFVVPLEPCPAPAEAGPVEAGIHRPGEPQGGRILLAEDYPSSRQVLTLHLERAGYAVTAVEDGAQLLAAATQAFDLIITDVQMPEVDGWEAAKCIRAGQGPCREVPIVALTADSGPATLERSREAGMSGVMTKPVRRDELLAVVERWLSSARAASPPSAGAAPPIDLATAAAEFGDAELVNTITAGFLARLDAQIRTMREAIGRRDSDSVRRGAHAIKGGAGTLTANAVAEQARRLEELSENGSPPETLSEALDDLMKESDRLRGYLSMSTAEAAHN